MDLVMPAVLGGLVLMAGAMATGDDGASGGGSSSNFDGIPARALSEADALSILQDAHDQRELNLQVGSAPFVSLGSEVHGVSFQYLVSRTPRPIAHVDARFAVLLLRLARQLAEHESVSVLYHLGIYPGRADHPNDVHNQGRAADLAGFRGSLFDLTVLSDWGRKPTPYPMATATETEYRLGEDQDPAYSFFLRLYRFCAEQGSDRSDAYVADQGSVTSIGEHSYVICPDHPTPKLRLAHQDHVHVQIGPTLV